jgi:hypothetical protein
LRVGRTGAWALEKRPAAFRLTREEDVCQDAHLRSIPATIASLPSRRYSHALRRQPESHPFSSTRAVRAARSGGRRTAGGVPLPAEVLGAQPDVRALRRRARRRPALRAGSRRRLPWGCNKGGRQSLTRGRAHSWCSDLVARGDGRGQEWQGSRAAVQSVPREQLAAGRETIVERAGRTQTVTPARGDGR